MNTIEVVVDGDSIEIIGVHCSLCINEIKIMGDYFEAVKEELFIEDGIYTMKVIFNPPEYVEGGLAHGSWYDFEQLIHTVHAEGELL